MNGPVPSESGDVVVAKTAPEVEALRGTWQAVGGDDVDVDVDYFLTYVQHAPDVIRPHVVRVRQAGRPDLFGIARVQEMRLPLTLGYWTLARFHVRAVVLQLGGILGARCRGDEDLVLTELRRPLDQGDADILVLQNLNCSSSRYDSAISRTSRLLRVNGQPTVRRWTAPIPDSLDAFLGARSAKTRRRLRSQDRKLEREYGTELTVRRYACLDDLERVCHDVEKVAAHSYQRALGVGHRGDALDRTMIELGLRRGWWRAWVLYLSGEPVAFWTGTSYRGTFRIGSPGFLPAHGKDAVGRYTMFRMVEDLCAEGASAVLDYGHGDADYKEAYGSATAEESTVVLLAPRARIVALGALASGTSILNTGIRRAVASSRWGGRVKRMWRRRLAGRGRSPTARVASNGFPAEGSKMRSVGWIVLPPLVRMRVAMARRALRVHGATGTARILLKRFATLPRRAKSDLRGRRFDLEAGVDTACTVSLAALDFESQNKDLGFRYQPIDHDLFRELLAAIPVRHDRFTFLDYGSGKGRALLLAAAFPFERVVGVEFSPQLHEVALANIAALPASSRRCGTIESRRLDAADFDPPDGPLVIFAYHPFQCEVWRPVLDRLRRSLTAVPREAHLLYIGTDEVGSMIEHAGFRPVWDRGDPLGSGQLRMLYRWQQR